MEPWDFDWKSQKVMKTEESPFWLVKSNNPNGAGARYQHPSHESAKQEAMRLAEANPGTEFFVFSPSESYVVGGMTSKKYR